MKRIACIVLSMVILALSLSSCALFEAVTAYGLYSKAMKTIEEAGGFEADCKMSMSMDILGQAVETSYDMNIKQNGDNMKMTMEILGAVTETVVIGDTVYAKIGNEKIKYVAVTEEQNEILESEMNDVLPDLAESVFEGIDVIKSEDGKKAITLTLDDETAKKLMGAMADEESMELSEAMSLENIFFTMKFSSKNVLESMTFDCDMTVDVLGMGLTSHMALEYSFINFGEAPEVLAPADADTYIDGGEYTGDL